MPDQPQTFAAALAAFQAAMPPVPKTKRASMANYTYSYAGLAEIVTLAAPIMAQHGLAFTCAPSIVDQDRLILVGTLMHINGEERCAALPITGTTPQQVGSAITYARRYLLGCLTGIVTEDDDDGQMASKPVGNHPAGRTLTVAPNPKAIAITRLANAIQERGMTDPQALKGLSKLLGRDITRYQDLTVKECEDAYTKLVERD
jgi:hypothetical protein